VGGQLRLEGGVAGEVQPVGVPVGTAARVENLFFNIPARLKFLKSDLTERRAIDDLVTRYALAYPQVRFHLQQENHPSLQTSGNGNRREILAALYGVEVAQQLLEVLADYDVVRINGYISPISLTRSNRREITFFVNGRWVHDAALTTALVQAYHTQLMVGRYPLAVLFLDLPPEMVDVNVHPAKAEVRFRDRDSVFSGVQRAVRRALLAYTPVPGLEAELLTPPQIPSFPPSQPSSAPAPFLPITPPPQLPASPTPLLRLVGQIASTYLVAEGPDGLYLIDQHAAHERVLFEKLMMQHAGGEEGENKIPTQSLLQPATVELPPAGARLLANQLPILARLGFQVEPFGPTTFLVRAIPALLSGADPVAALRVIVEDFEEDETPLQAELEARLIARVCKRAAVKAGQTLSPAEQHALLDGLESCSSPRTCPHGRPTMIHLSVDLLERQFGRRGAR
jgi:DNA mismatch repair protein MutL